MRWGSKHLGLVVGILVHRSKVHQDAYHEAQAARQEGENEGFKERAVGKLQAEPRHQLADYAGVAELGAGYTTNLIFFI